MLIYRDGSVDYSSFNQIPFCGYNHVIVDALSEPIMDWFTDAYKRHSASMKSDQKSSFYSI